MPSLSCWRNTWAYESEVIYGMTETLANNRIPRRSSIRPRGPLLVGKVDKLKAQMRERDAAPA